MIGIKEKLFKASGISHDILRHIVQRTVTLVHVLNLKTGEYQPIFAQAFGCFLKLLCFDLNFQALVFSKSMTLIAPYCKYYPC